MKEYNFFTREWLDKISESLDNNMSRIMICFKVKRLLFQSFFLDYFPLKNVKTSLLKPLISSYCAS